MNKAWNNRIFNHRVYKTSNNKYFNSKANIIRMKLIIKLLIIVKIL